MGDALPIWFMFDFQILALNTERYCINIVKCELTRWQQNKTVVQEIHSSNITLVPGKPRSREGATFQQCCVEAHRKLLQFRQQDGATSASGSNVIVVQLTFFWVSPSPVVSSPKYTLESVEEKTPHI